MTNAVLVWSITATTIAAILFRPKQWPEAVWACLGAGLLIAFRLISIGEAARAVSKGLDVYLFLAGMMLLADLARKEGVFDWLATHAVTAAAGSAARLFALIFGVGVAVTVFLSNDATAVVLTPAVYAAVRRARVPPRPYLFTCAFVANAASFVLPISNPANLVVYGKSLPPLLAWLREFALPSLLAIAATFFALRWQCRHQLHGTVDATAGAVHLTAEGFRAAVGIALTAIVLIVASALALNLGLFTLLPAVAVVLITIRFDGKALRELTREVSWSVIPLVAGLFILVETLALAGAAHDIGFALQRLESLPAWAGALAASFGVAAVSNVMNNLPSGLLTGSAVAAVHVPRHIRDALLIGIDLGPNLSVTGSLATMLWLIALRREGEHVNVWTFLKIGAAVMTPALLVATVALLI